MHTSVVMDTQPDIKPEVKTDLKQEVKTDLKIEATKVIRSPPKQPLSPNRLGIMISKPKFSKGKSSDPAKAPIKNTK